MKFSLIFLFALLIFQLSVFPQDTKDLNKEEPLPEIKESKEKKIYFYFQGASGFSETEFEKGKIHSPKLGFEYRFTPFFGIGLGLSHNSLNLTEKDTSSGAILAYLLLTAPITNRSANIIDDTIMSDRLQLASNLIAPQNYYYRYNALQVDFNMHFNKSNFFDPYLGFGIIAGKGNVTVIGGEIKSGIQLNFETFFTYAQLQGQVLKLRESTEDSFQSRNLIGSIGAGVRF